jgi:hypothetical protein
LGSALTIVQASDETSAKDEGINKVLTFSIGAASFGMKPVDIVSSLKADGYTVTREVPASNYSTGSWVLKKGASSGDRSTVNLTASNDVATRLTVTFVSGSGSSYDMDTEFTRLIEHFGSDPCENARRMHRCYFPDGNRRGDIILKATLDSRMYSLEFSNKRK